MLTQRQLFVTFTMKNSPLSHFVAFFGGGRGGEADGVLVLTLNTFTPELDSQKESEHYLLSTAIKGFKLLPSLRWTNTTLVLA